MSGEIPEGLSKFPWYSTNLGAQPPPPKAQRVLSPWLESQLDSKISALKVWEFMLDRKSSHSARGDGGPGRSGEEGRSDPRGEGFSCNCSELHISTTEVAGILELESLPVLC